jgi:SAM-dependent methyltransferase
MTFFPLDSTRYFEFDFLWRRALGAGGGPYLDVSSPRLFPLVFVRERRPAAADLVNPDASDLAVTARLVSAAGLDSRCRLHAETVDRLPFADGTYDLVTSMSVLEHIADDVQAVRTMWRVLRPGGRLLLTVPCARTASEQFIDKDEYGVLPPDAAGWWFWQRFYDERLLDRHVFAITGAPIHQEVYGEKTAGAFQANAAVKRADPAYPFWREPLMMARDYARFERVGDLPGEGVVGMEFVK